MSAFLTAPARAGGESSGALPFTIYELNFTPTSDTVTLAVQNLRRGAIAVDDVGLTRFVPEPATWGWIGMAVYVIFRTQHATRKAAAELWASVT